MDDKENVNTEYETLLNYSSQSLENVYKLSIIFSSCFISIII